MVAFGALMEISEGDSNRKPRGKAPPLFLPNLPARMSLFFRPYHPKTPQINKERRNDFLSLLTMFPQSKALEMPLILLFAGFPKIAEGVKAFVRIPP